MYPNLFQGNSDYIYQMAKNLYLAGKYGRRLSREEQRLADMYYMDAMSKVNMSVLNTPWEYDTYRYTWEGYANMRSRRVNISPDEKVNLNKDIFVVKTKESNRYRQETKNVSFDFESVYGGVQSMAPGYMGTLDISQLDMENLRRLIRYGQPTTEERSRNMKHKIKKPDGSMFSWTVDGGLVEVATSDKELRDALTALPPELRKGSQVISFDDTLPDEKRSSPGSTYVTSMIDSIIATAASKIREEHQKVTLALRKVNCLMDVTEGMVSGSNIFMTSTMDASMADSLRRLEDVKVLIASFRAAMVIYDEVSKLKTW